MAKKDKNPSFILELKMIPERWQLHLIDKRFDIAWKLYNTTLSYVLKQVKLMKESKAYRKQLHFLRNAKSLLKETKNEKQKEVYQYELQLIYKQLTDIRLSFGVSEFQLHSYIKKHQHNYKKHLDSLLCQKIATRVWKSMEEMLFKGKKAHFKKYGTLDSVEGKTNTSGIRFVENHVKWNGLVVPVAICENDLFVKKALAYQRIKYCRIVKKFIHGKQTYYVQLVMDGTPPPKRVHATGEFRHKPFPDKRVGIDIGTSTVAVSSETEVFLNPLAPKVLQFEQEKRRLLRKLDRSKRSMNPQNYNADSTIKRGIKLTWTRSKTYMRTYFKLKELIRKRSVYVKHQHSKLANHILSLGNDVYVEKMNFKGLAKRSKTTKKNKKSKFISKKRFGKSIGSHAPAMLIRIINQKLGYLTKELNEVNTYTFKASQYNHVTDTYKKKKLHQRWTYIDKQKVQRDLYSAFLIMNSDTNLKHANQELCTETFKTFMKLHDKQIEILKQMNGIYPSSMGIQKAS